MNAAQIYNMYLSVSRGRLNKPWKARKDFQGFETTSDGVYCRKLEFFFKKFPQISVKEFLSAPYEIYKDETYFPLKFYVTQKAIAVYSAVQKQKLEESPDTPSQIEDIKKSLKHIGLTCVARKISFEQYCLERAGYTYTPVLDFNNKLINIYVLIKLPSFDTIVNSLNLQDKELYLKNIHNNLGKFKLRLNMSTRAKFLIDEGFKLLTKNTKNTKNTKTT